MRIVALAGLFALALVAGPASAAAPSAGTALVVTYWPDGSTTSVKKRWTLRCAPPGGTLRRPARACRKLEGGGLKLFAPVPPDAVCTQIYGGPQKARVIGIVNGRRVWASFERSNGCHIERWQRLSPWLLPPGGT